MIDELLKTFGNYTRSLEILYLLNGIKKIVRLDANEVELARIKDLCNGNNLHLEVSDFKVIKVTDDGKGGYSNIVKKIPINHSDEGLYHLYISKDKDKTTFLKLLENKNDDKAVGELLGYPQCCINFFIENKEKQQKIQNDYILPALNNSKGFEFPFYNNYALRYFDFTLLSHFPHSFNCEESIKIAKNSLECIKNNSIDLATIFETILKGPVLYTEKNGIFLFKNHKFNKDILEFDTVISTTSSELLTILNNNKTIGIIDKNNIKLDNKMIEDVGFMVFI